MQRNLSMNTINDIHNNPGQLSRKSILTLLNAEGKEKEMLFRESARIKEQHVGKKVYYRGLVEFSNVCSKNCYYCGIRKANQSVERYQLSDEAILDAVRFAYEKRYGSVVLQSGEISSPSFAKRIAQLLSRIKEMSNGTLGVTLSLGEQPAAVYREWKEKGAHRYLMRIETSNPELYKKLHPNDQKHDYTNRVKNLQSLQQLGYQTGTGVMIGLPFQTLEDLADDLLFMHHFDIDMVGMGPYIEHEETPLYRYRHALLSETKRFDLTLKMIAILRIMMKDINIAATTAMQALDRVGREKAIQVGANVIMPNVTPGMYRDNYALYNNKPCTHEEAADCTNCLDIRMAMVDAEVAYGERGDPIHYFARTAKRKKNIN